jgi:hypothetical protein
MEGIIAGADLYDNSMLATRVIGLAKNSWSVINESKALKSLGQLTGLISIYDNLEGFGKEYKANKVGAMWHLTKAVATTGFLIFGGEEAELSWNIATFIIDKAKIFGK